jgi:hypothetical protein
MELTKQLSLFLANKPGTLADVCDALAAEGINISALTTSDTVDHSVVRMVVSDTDKALAIFESSGTLAIETEVLVLDNDNKPGSLARVARVLAGLHINIEYAYLASSPESDRGLLVLRTTDNLAALAAIKSPRTSA